MGKRGEALQVWNAKIDRTKTIMWKGRNGIQYEYLIPLHADEGEPHEVALDVRSHKGDNTNPSRSKKYWGKVFKPGQYQPVGDKSHFTFYQQRQIKNLKDPMADLEVERMIHYE